MKLLHFAWVVDHEKCIVVTFTRICVSVRGRMPTLLHGRGCNLGEWSGMPPSCALMGGFAVAAWVALLWQHYWNVWQSQRLSAWPDARRTRAAHAQYACRRRLPSSALGDNIDAPAACTVPFRPYCGGVVMRTRNVSEYMLVLALCLGFICDNWRSYNIWRHWFYHTAFVKHEIALLVEYVLNQLRQRVSCTCRSLVLWSPQKISSRRTSVCWSGSWCLLQQEELRRR